MDHLTEPLIEYKSDKVLLQDEGTLPSISVTSSRASSEDNSLEDDQHHKERISSFIDVGDNDMPRATTYSSTVPVTLRNGKRRGVTIPATGAPPELLAANFMRGSPGSSYSGTGENKKQSVIVAGDDHFILEEPNPDSLQATDIDGRHSVGLAVSQFVNVHVSQCV